MRWMGLDVGDKTIGVALSDEMGWTAQGLEVIRRSSKEKDFLRLQTIIDQNQVVEIIVGLPKNMNNTIGHRGQLCVAFAEEIATRFQLPVHLWDERLSTVAATKTLLEADLSRKKRKSVIDQLAATFILQNYMDAKQKR
jgi:putative Holliday junction resolvase